MFAKEQLKSHLAKVFCSKCNAPLDAAEFVAISELPLAIVGHAVCQKCKSENMVTITSVGTGVMPMMSDLNSREVSKFAKAQNVTFDDVLKLHKMLKSESLWNLMHKKEKNLVKRTKV